MIRATPILLAVGLLLAAPSSHAVTMPPVVGNLVASQREGTKLVDITYDLEVPDAATATVTLRISSDGGDTWTVPTTSATGDVGAGVEPGTGKAIVWNAGIDWPGRYSEQMRFRVVADDGIPDPAPAGFSLIPAGTFMMGRTSDSEDTWLAPSATSTTLAKHFYMAKTETSKGQWDSVRTWGSTNGYTDLPAGDGKATNHPVQNIDWWAVVKWCNARSEMEGLTPCYYTNAGFGEFGPPFRAGIGQVLVDGEANGYRLPTALEWERAARGGIDGKRFPWGDDTISHAQANYQAIVDISLTVPIDYDESIGTGHHPSYNGDGAPYTSPVDSFGEHGYGLQNMAGNVSEWTWNGSSPDYRYFLGGNWGGSASQCRPAYRPFSTPTHFANYIGFRVARSSVSGGL